ncbi:hypothetical protein GCM10009533_08550 [Saccharopolyspora spinosporotrichia]|uniref:Uncharacterized protein n=1 Tax=Saccharopolyspora erythraea TaxID=1836 RepID=A0ABP3M2J2_SACER
MTGWCTGANGKATAHSSATAAEPPARTARSRARRPPDGTDGTFSRSGNETRGIDIGSG